MTYPTVSLRELGDIQTGNTPLTSENAFWGGDVPFVTPGELDAQNPIISAPRSLTAAGVANARLIKANSVLVSCIGSLGKVGIAGRDLVTNQQINSIIFDESKLFYRYGFHACRQLKGRLAAIAPATTIPIVSKTKFSELQIPVPGMIEQRRIAAILDKADALRAERREALAHVKSLANSTFLSMFGDPEKNLKRLPVLHLHALCTRITDGTHQSPKWQDEGIPFLFISNIVDGQIRYETDKYISMETYQELTRRCPIETGDVLYTTVGSYGNTAVVTQERDFCFQRHIAHIKPDRTKLDSTFCAHMLQSPGVRKQVDQAARGVAQKTVNLQDLKTLRVFGPSLQSQMEFADKIKAVTLLQDTQIRALAYTDDLFRSLEHRAFTGSL